LAQNVSGLQSFSHATQGSTTGGVSRKDVIEMDAIDEQRTVSELWTHAQTAGFLKISIKTLHVWNSKGIGPRSYKVNGGRRYAPRDVQDFLRQRYTLTRAEQDSHGAV
jgi:DNA-binding transcriptional MerR regulator